MSGKFSFLKMDLQKQKFRGGETGKPETRVSGLETGRTCNGDRENHKPEMRVSGLETGKPCDGDKDSNQNRQLCGR
jgi:hypothetical protein